MRVNFGTRKQKRLIILVSLFALILIAAGLFLLHRWEMRDEARMAETLAEQNLDGTPENQVRYQGKWYRENPEIEKILLIGVDKFDTQLSAGEEDFRNDQQSDFLALMLLNQEDGSYRVLFLNRDTMADVPLLDVNGQEFDTRRMQLALAHTYGNGRENSCRNTAQAVSNLLYGVEIDHYVSVTMDAVAVLNDLVGGVTVHVEDDFSNTDPTIVQGTDVTLLGEHALNFVRARSSMAEPTNLARMERQRAYLKALRQKTMECIDTDEGFVFDALMELSDYMVSDCTINTLATYFDAVSRNGEPEVLTLDGESVAGEQYMEYYVDEDALQANIIEWFYTPVE